MSDTHDPFITETDEDRDRLYVIDDVITLAVATDKERLDKAIASQVPDLSRSRVQGLIRDGFLSIGDRVIEDPNHRVNAGDVLTLSIPAPAPANPQPQALPLDIVYEDTDLIVVEKPVGLIVHPGAGTPDGTLVNALLHHCRDSLSGIGGVLRPGIVHRLDKDTSGLLVVAKTDRAHADLAAQFADHGRTGSLDRGYKAFVWGAPSPRRQVIDAAIGRHPNNPTRMAVRSDGRRALTHLTVDTVYGPKEKPLAALVECKLETGRTHQIRVHLANLGHPILGDPVYGAHMNTKVNRLPISARSTVTGLQRQALHAYLLQIVHPISREILRFESPLPSDLSDLRRVLAASSV